MSTKVHGEDFVGLSPALDIGEREGFHHLLGVAVDPQDGIIFYSQQQRNHLPTALRFSHQEKVASEGGETSNLGDVLVLGFRVGGPAPRFVQLEDFSLQGVRPGLQLIGKIDAQARDRNSQRELFTEICHSLKQLPLVLFVVVEVDLKLYGGQVLGLLQGHGQGANLHYALTLFKLHVQLKQIPSIVMILSDFI